MKTQSSLIALTAVLLLSAFAQPALADQSIVVPSGTTNTTGIVTNGGNDAITVETNAAVLVSATGAPAVVAINPGGGTNVVANSGVTRATGILPSSTNASLSSTAISTGSGQNTIFNNSDGTPVNGLIEATVAVHVAPATGDEMSSVSATATGIASGGTDAIVNGGTINATANSTLTRGFPLVVNLIGLQQSSNSTTAEAVATGIAGATSATSTGTINATATALINPFSISLSLVDASSADATMTANAFATGIRGGPGTSSLTNHGQLAASANATADSIGITLALADAASGAASLNANANATGIAGGNGVNSIYNTGQIAALAQAHAASFNASLSLAAAAGADVALTADAQATGMAGGAAGDELTNTGLVSANANSDATRVGIAATLYDLTIAQSLFSSPASAGTTSSSTVVGMDGAGGNDVMANQGGISATANSTLVAVGVSFNSYGTPSVSDITNVIFGHSLADIDRIAAASATGMTGGLGDDNLLNAGPLTSTASANLTAVGVDIGVGLPFAPGLPLNFSVTSAASSNSATALGLDGGGGNDTIRNTSSLNTAADAQVVNVVAGLNVEFDTDISLSGSLVDASTSGHATAAGMSGGTGDDTLINEVSGQNNVSATTHVSSTLVSADIVGKVKGVEISVPVASAEALSDANATGMDGGDGNDIVRNEGNLTTASTAEAINTVVSLDVTGVAQGVSADVALADASATAQATAAGMAGGAGNDLLLNAAGANNDVSSVAHLTSTGVAASFIGPTEGLAVAVGNVEASTLATAQAAGISGGEGADTIRNDGLTAAHAGATNRNNGVSVGVTVTLDTGVGLAGARVAADTEARVESAGISAGNGGSTVVNDGTVQAAADAMVQTVGVSVAANIGIGGGLVNADVATLANSIATGIRGGAGNDFITNSSGGDITATANSEVQSVGVGVNLSIVGAGLSDASASATNVAAGIAGGAGNDTISNEGHIAATASARGTATAVTFGGVASGSWAISGTTANATAVGLDGGTGANRVSNSGTLDAQSQAHLNAGAISITGSGYTSADASSVALAESVGMTGGDEGNLLLNTGNIQANASSDARSTSVSVTPGIGVMNADASTVANAIATGIESGADNDFITNSTSGTIVAGAASTNRAASVGVHVVAPGGGFADATVTATNRATGIASGGGQDTVSNEGQITVAANATGYATTVNFAGLIGGGEATAGTTAESLAIGMDGGAGADVLQNSGTLDVFAMTGLDAGSVTFEGGGYASADAQATSRASSIGLDGGAGSDVLRNSGTLSVFTRSGLEAGSISIDVVGYSSAGAQATSTANSMGMAGGAGDDSVSNSGTVNLGATSQLNVSSKAFTVAGYASAEVAETSAEALASGMNGDEGNDALVNDGLLSITPTGGQPMAQATGRGTSWSLLGVNEADVVLSANVDVVGMAGGDGNDTIVNRGTNIVGGPLGGTAMAVVDASGSSWAFGGGAGAAVVAAANTTSTGLSGGAGNNGLKNDGVTEVNATAYLHSDSDAYATFGGSASSARILASSTAIGIGGGAGNDSVVNAGELIVNSSARSVSRSHADTGIIYGDGDTTSVAESMAAAAGIAVGDGQNELNNSGQIHVLATTLADAYAYSDGGDIVDGDATSRTSATVTSRAVGISAGNGTNRISNTGTLSVVTRKAQEDEAMAVAHAEADGDGIDGDGRGTAVATVTASSIGIEVGDGMFDISNAGALTISAEPTAVAAATVDADASGTATRIREATAIGEAVGIKTGNGNGQINNAGILAVSAHASVSAPETATASAMATGILTGDGTHQITNSGTIAVEARTDSVYGGAALSAVAVGIQTGDGDDTIVNSGSISATNQIGDARTLGTAINSGGGNDRIHLVGGSTTIGALNAGAGTDTLVLEGEGSYGAEGSGALLGFEHATKIGAGKFTLWPGMPTMDRLEMVAGVLELNGDYTFKGSGVTPETDGYFGAWVNGNGNHGQLLVLGQANLDGNITVERGPGPFAIGLTTFDVLVATNGVVDSFTSTNLPDARPLLSFGVNQLADRVQAQALGLSFTTVAHNKVELAVAKYLDRILVPGDTSDLGHVLDTMQQLTEPEFPDAFSSLSPDSYDAYTRATYATVWQHSKSMQQRLGTLRSLAANRSESQAAAFHMPKPVLLASADDDLGGVISREQQQARQNPNGIWADTFGQWSDQQGKDGYTGFDYNVWGVTLGYDRAVGDRLTLGLSGAYAASSVNLDNHRGSGDIESISGSAYGSFVHENLHLEGVLSYGNHDYENQRNLVIGSINRVAKSSHNGQALGMFLSGGYAWQLKRLVLEPFASLQYTHLDEDSFNETGAGDVSLSMKSRATESLVSELGLRLACIVQKKTFTFIPELNLAWNYDFAIDDRTLRAAYAGSPGATLSLPGQDVEPHGVTGGGGITFLFKNDVATSLRYKGEFRDNYSAHAVVGELRFNF